MLDHPSRPSGLPLILAALPEHHALFHQVSHNPFLMAEGIHINPESLSIDELRERAWRVVEPQYEARLTALIGDFKLAESQGLGGDELALVAKSAASGRVATLLIDSDRQIPGRVNSVTGRIESADLSDPRVDDLLDDVSELVEKMGGQVVLLPVERMPGQMGLAAIYRY